MATAALDRVRLTAAGIAGTRAAIGVGLLLAPRLGRRMAGIDRDPDGSQRAMMAMFAVRELVLGVAMLRAVASGYPTPAQLRLNALCDGGDTVVLLCNRGRPGIGRLTLGAPVSAAVSATWLWLARQTPGATTW
jgi:hypothetical protein